MGDEGPHDVTRHGGLVPHVNTKQVISPQREPPTVVHSQ